MQVRLPYAWPHFPLETRQNRRLFLRAEVTRAARVYGKYRWRQGYRLEEVIREASVVRRIISHNWLDAYARKVPALDSGTRRVAENIIHQAVDDVVSDSAAQFVQEQLRATNHLNSQLADALAELRHQKRVAGAAKTTKKRKRPSRG